MILKAVSGVLVFKDQVFVIERSHGLSVFPGYFAFPGGKIDPEDLKQVSPWEEKFEIGHVHTLFREISEEVGINFFDHPELISELSLMGDAITPDFNPYRFQNYYYKIILKSLPNNINQEMEIKNAFWDQPVNILAKYDRGEILCVPIFLKILKSLEQKINSSLKIELKTDWDNENRVPMLEPIKGVLQFLPLSNTFPPANRTNCYLIDGVLVDPSPRDEVEMRKLLRTIGKKKVTKIFLTHHHQDHHQFCTDIAEILNVGICLSRITFDFIVKKWGENYFRNSRVSYISDGEVLCRYQHENVFCIAVPGHDAGQIALTVNSKKWFLAGDLIQSVGTVVVGGEEGNMQDYFDSLQNVIDINPVVVFPSHGIALGGVAKVKMTLKHRKMRETQIGRLLDEGKDVDDIFNSIYPGLESKLKRYAIRTIEAHIAKIYSSRITNHVNRDV